MSKINGEAQEFMYPNYGEYMAKNQYACPECRIVFYSEKKIE